jgi:hypothetical protein
VVCLCKCRWGWDTQEDLECHILIKEVAAVAAQTEGTVGMGIIKEVAEEEIWSERDGK